MVPRIALLLSALLLCGCNPPDGDSGLGHAPGTGAQPGLPSGPRSDQPSRQPSGGSSGFAVSRGWTVTVYYTAVAALHAGRTVRVTGCRVIDCSDGHDDLGTYPASFVSAVEDEGTGRIAEGRYLNWSYDTGYWLDTAPRDTAGRALRPWESAAADSHVLPAGARFSVVQCGHDEDGDAIDAGVCARLREAQWTITDEFTPGLGGAKHVDLYIGEETGPDFTSSPLYTTLKDATLALG